MSRFSKKRRSYRRRLRSLKRRVGGGEPPILVGIPVTEKNVIIPSVIGEMAVRVIPSNAFINRTNYLVTVTIPASVETIQENAFLNCSKLKTVIFEPGSRLRTIEKGAFGFCSDLTSIEIPPSIQKIDTKAFQGCYFLQTGNLPTNVIVEHNAYGEKEFTVT